MTLDEIQDTMGLREFERYYEQLWGIKQEKLANLAIASRAAFLADAKAFEDFIESIRTRRETMPTYSVPDDLKPEDQESVIDAIDEDEQWKKLT